jgi:hypothetical protein
MAPLAGYGRAKGAIGRLIRLGAGELLAVIKGRVEREAGPDSPRKIRVLAG